MIKVNLLQNTIEPTRLDVVESAITRRGTQQMLLVVIALCACVLACGADYFITVRDNGRVKEEVVAEEQIAVRLQQVTAQANELQAKNKAVEDRINAIMRLRAEQTGPLRVMQMVDLRMPADANFRLRSIKQDGNAMIVNGYAPSEATVTSFAKNLEFSDGLFTNFLVETRLIPNPEIPAGAAQQAANNAEAKPAKGGKVDAQPKFSPQVVEFTVRYGYNPQSQLVSPEMNQNGAASVPPTQTAQNVKQ
ncbi:MAG TPA: hypothetical protein VEF04_15950 [Blastocatellia bacterium]|nr:hypothetical protein [Blastocatellia bacterium]